MITFRELQAHINTMKEKRLDDHILVFDADRKLWIALESVKVQPDNDLPFPTKGESFLQIGGRDLSCN